MHSVDSKTEVRISFRTACLLAVALLIGGGDGILAQGNDAGKSGPPSVASVPKMRTRLLTSLTGYEVADYIKRNDVIFVPVGPTEINGGNPTDVEYVIPLAYALKLAEKSDGLVLPYLSYFYPGSTTISPGTVMVTPEEGLAYLKVITRSLVRQGFRRIVFLTSHGPSTAFPFTSFIDSVQSLAFEIGYSVHRPAVLSLHN